jgi:pyruvate dehydrogenase E2 component (dihydrolipoamide acetyltransferase)
MSSELKLPELGENITQGTVTKVLVKAGDTVKKGQNILELETDKAVLEVPSNTDGTISEVLVQSGAVVKVGQPVFKLGGGSAAPAAKPAEQPKAESIAKPAAVLSTATKEEPAAPAAAPSGAPSASGAVVDMNLPNLGENIEKGTITKVLVKAGDVLKKGTNILEIETDKAVLEVPSPSEGLVKEVLVQAGTVVKVGQPVFKIQGGVTSAPAAKPAVSAPAAKAAPTKAASAAAPAAASHAPAQTTGHTPVRTNIPAAPSTRLFARELGIDLAQVPGTGAGGRISIADIKAFAKTIIQGGGGRPALVPLPNFGKFGNVRREPMNNVRKKTAEHLSNAWNSIPHVTQFDKADITELEKLRKAKSTPDRRLSITPYIIKAIALGMKKYPQFNASVDMQSQEIVYKDYVNIGCAVDTDRGLLVPVLKNVDKMSIEQIADELTAIAEKARNKKTTLDDMSGGGFTISNLGGIGGQFFTPIVNWPEVAILGVSRGVMEPVFVDGNFVPKLMLPVSLSYDHRLIDGADGARFIRFLVETIQQPDQLS